MKREKPTLEGAAVGTLDGNIEISEVILVRSSRDTWCGVGYETFCLLISVQHCQKGEEEQARTEEGRVGPIYGR